MKLNKIKAWYPILKWTTPINFSTCHTHDNFEREYYKDDEIEALISNIMESLYSHGSMNARLIGKMGAGKTTFLNYLSKIISQDETLSSSIFLSIIRASKVDDYSEYEINLQNIIIDETYRKYFYDAGFRDEFLRIFELKESSLNKITQLKKINKENQINFKKKLIVVLDDMDTLDEIMAQKIALSFKKTLGSGSISKWISIRNTTYNKYSDETKKIFTFFSEQLPLPDVSLYEIIQKRIYLNHSKETKNPFSKELCSKISQLKEGSVRDSLTTLKSTLQYIPPKTDRAEEFIQNWFTKSAITALLKNDDIPNVHTERYISIFNYPVAYDLLNIIKFSFIKPHIFSILGNVARYDRESTVYEGKFVLLENQLEKVIKILEEDKLIKIVEGNIKLTFKGKMIIEFGQTFYNDICMKLSKKDIEEDINEDYWLTLTKKINYKQYAEKINVITD
jgi:energy-coupling factor transporter ATP-binding protein EcfA2